MKAPTRAGSMQPISKIEAARRQLDQAIALFFFGGDSVSVHSLALNAFEISSSVARHQGASDWLDMVREDTAKNLGIVDKKSFFNVFHRARNFFKHAGKDPTGELPDFSDGHNDFAVSLTVFQFGEIAERTMPMWAFLVWFYAAYPEFPVPGALDDDVSPYRGIHRLDRDAQLVVGRLIIQDFRQRLE